MKERKWIYFPPFFLRFSCYFCSIMLASNPFLVLPKISSSFPFKLLKKEKEETSKTT